ncbi:3,4-dihydroxy-2-butanone 4-phosphate synthase / GTP cyclohydrolase II [Liberibacter crescens BT-1]|uniref:3,4-dihydroxy-2-butanone 4-phosphate synthase n=1 Tax=Liberibacter crescens (strain BT-1) TaxID=1215343 RepID=L0ETD4_LIBCB|nr:3,4-dihydroxy-2-butanone-4-phosphate synthase [Liberibacter crescens]AGA64217.1 3,4-dihydroxy-2-butanone 4-phosphate synthase / GTP cyclohydrolase II [Liberibacter crescens BT-1]AMC12465.1 3,4-dihydroxy-2-butanone 4-phosphate synthase [Liberibacter crescens]
MLFNQQKVSDAIQAFGKGEIVIVTDENDRENEADLIIAATHCTIEKMAFIIRHTSGIVCTPMPYTEANRLHLNLMVASNESIHSTAFTISIDSKDGITTGISASDRTRTVQNLANPNSKPSDFTRPGHIFPLIAREGGVLTRSGHTEASVDMCKLAQLPPIAVICELVNDNGTVKEGKEVFDFAKKHNLKIISVSDIIIWRQREEHLIILKSSCKTETSIGTIQVNTYCLPKSTLVHTVLIVGDIENSLNTPIPVYVHRENFVEDILLKKSPIDYYLNQISIEGKGIIIYLRNNFSDHETIKTISSPFQTPPIKENNGSKNQKSQETGLIAQILKNLCITSVKILSTNTHYPSDLKNYGITIHK